MIKSLTGSGYITVSNPNSNIPYIASSTPSAGIMRYLDNNIQVYDGSYWHTLGGTIPSIELSSSASAAIEWAVNKMQEEKKLDELCDKYPALRKARGNYETIKALVDAGIEL